ncbi:MAG TPA: hypothetical protein PKB13_07395 [Clostridia bacterium]|nr:hypothetical protein [Clostridia bacterium]
MDQYNGYGYYGGSENQYYQKEPYRQRRGAGGYIATAVISFVAGCLVMSMLFANSNFYTQNGGNSQNNGGSQYPLLRQRRSLPLRAILPCRSLRPCPPTGTFRSSTAQPPTLPIAQIPFPTSSSR